MDGENKSDMKYELIAKVPNKQREVLGREIQLETIEQFFNDNNVLFLEGIAGIGKSELAREYARTTRRHETVIYATYSGSLRDLVLDPWKICINGLYQYISESEDAYYHRKLDVLRKLGDKKTLIVVDNFDVDNDPDLAEFIGGDYDVLFTTRFQHRAYPSIKVEEIKDSKVLVEIFEKYYGLSVKKEEEDELLELFSLVGYHTYAIELLAKQMDVGFYSIEQMLEVFRKGQFFDVKEGIEERGGVETAFNHICTLFSMSEMSEEELVMLRELSLAKICGIPAQIYLKWTSAAFPEKTIRELVNKGWVKKENEGRIQKFLVHPLVVEIVHGLDKMRPTKENCRMFLERMADSLYVSWHMPYFDNMIIADSVLAISNYFSPFDFSPEDKEMFEIWEIIPNFLWQVGKYKDSIRIGKELYYTSLRICGEASIITGFAAKALGACFYNGGYADESVIWYLQGLKSMQMSGEEESEDLALAYEKAGRCYTWENHRDYSKAEQLFFKALEIRARLLCKVETGETYESVEKRNEHSIKRIEIGSGQVYYEMGKMYQLKGEYNRAIEYIERFLQILESLDPENTSSLACVYHDRGVCYLHMGLAEKENGKDDEAQRNFCQAITELERALTLNMKMRGLASIETINCQENLSDAYLACGNWKKAQDGYYNLIDMLENLYGSEHERIYSVRRKLFLKKITQEQGLNLGVSSENGVESLLCDLMNHVNEVSHELRALQVQNEQGFDTIEKSVKKSTDSIKEEVREGTAEVKDYISEQISNLRHFVSHELKDNLYIERVLLEEKLNQNTHGTERLITDFINEQARYINVHIHGMNDLVTEEERFLQHAFGEKWVLLEGTSKASLRSASVLLKCCAEIIDSNFDYSGICISATAALETELYRLFYLGFQKYLCNEIGVPDTEKWEHTYNEWPEVLLSTRCSKFIAELNAYHENPKKYEKPVIKIAKKNFTLGTMPYLFGLNEKKESEMQRKLVRKQMRRYLAFVSSERGADELMRYFDYGSKREMFMDKSERIRKTYRNKAAHIEVISREEAVDCCTEIIGSFDAVSHILQISGLIMEMFNKLESVHVRWEYFADVMSEHNDLLE